MTERRYNDDEVAAIFELASKSERTDLPASEKGEGLTLSALQDVGREIGISPESISAAVQALSQAPKLSSERFLGLPIGVGRTVEFERPITDAEWEGLVADLRTTFNARGMVRYDGPFRQWTNGNLQALVEPTRTGHRLRLQTVKGSSRSQMGAGTLLLGGAAAVFIMDVVVPFTQKPGAFAAIGFIALMGLGMFAAGSLMVPGWAKRRGAQFDEIIARLNRALGASDKAP
jgi:hypothetical protein